jgi:MoxR-like ATPase
MKSSDRSVFMSTIKSMYGDIDVISRPQVVAVAKKLGTKLPAWLTNDPSIRILRGMYSLKGAAPVTVAKAEKPKVAKPVKAAAPAVIPSVSVANDAEMVIANLSTNEVSLVPAKAKGYVPFGHYNDIRSIISSNKFYPVYVTGLSGNGKTMMVEQVSSALGRECVRVNITIETDEDDLIGGFRLLDGKTVWQNGPVIVAMERGATLLLDEVDLGSNKLMCLQPILEGKPVYLKKINRVVHPAPGFNVIATANTKGKGSDDGRFIGTNVMNEAFLERFSITLEQEYPAQKVEAKILNNVLATSNIEDKEFVEKLVMWADVIRKSFYEGAVTEVISTRRLVHICEAYSIFNQDRTKAIQLCLNRFDVDTKTAFLDLYAKLDEKAQTTAEVAAAPSDEEIAF